MLKTKNLFQIITILALFLFFYFAGCSSSSSSGPDYNPPEDHTISKNGFKHKPGLNDPELNCISCHGQDLRGGETDVSCYECHKKKW